jgi:hypothetical protein
MSKPEPPKSQSEKFKAMAKEVEADGDEKAFDKTLKKISNLKPPKEL